MKITQKYKIINKINILGISLILIMLVLAQPSLSQETTCDLDYSGLEEQLNKSGYSEFQKTTVSDVAKELLSFGVNSEEVEKILEESIENKFDAYNIKIMFDTLIDIKKEDLPEKPLLNKIKEGLAKRADDRSIINVLEKEANHLKTAKKILQERKIGYDSSNQKMIEVLVESLNNGVPSQTLDDVISKSIKQGKSSEEIADISTELGNLSLRAYELGFSEEEVNDVFQKAVLSRSGVEGICEDIQEMLVATVVTKTNMASRNNSGGTDNPTGTVTGDETTSSGSVIPSPSSGSISIPTSSDDKPDSGDKQDSGDSSPPEN